MANHKSAKKRIRQNATRRLRNRFRMSTTRTWIKRLETAENKEEAQAMLPKVVSMIDRSAKVNLYHKNKASNLKSRLTRLVNAM